MTRSALQATSDFYQSSPGIRLFRLMLGASQRLWPALAVRAALRLFGTPLPPRWLQRRHEWDCAWRIDSWKFENASVTLYSRPVAAHGPVVLLVPGWGGHARQMLALAEALGQQGMHPVIVEMPAHGAAAAASATCRSSPARSSTSQLAWCRRATPFAQWSHIHWPPMPRRMRPAAARRWSGWCCWRRPPRRANTHACLLRCSACRRRLVPPCKSSWKRVRAC